MRVEGGCQSDEAMLTLMNADNMVMLSCAGPSTSLAAFGQVLAEKARTMRLLGAVEPTIWQVDTVAGLLSGFQKAGLWPNT